MTIDRDLHDSDSHISSYAAAHTGEGEREISLGTATILGIFLALALVCAAFFGFGYSLGRRSASSVAASAATDVKASPAETKAESPFDHFKTAPPPATTSKAALSPVAETPEAQAAETADAPVTPLPARKPADSQPTRSVAFPVPSPSAETDQPAAAIGQFVVQISAPSHQADADALLAALSRKGYKAFIRKEPQDNFFHVQVGPFATKPEAVTMSKRLDADGYKPFIK